MTQPSHIETVSHGSTSITLAGGEFEVDALVVDKTVVSAGVAALTLTRSDGKPFPRWTPGSHVDLILDDAPTRQYSLCGDLADQWHWRLGVLRDAQGRGSSRYVHDTLAAGDTVRIRGPRNHFPLVDARSYLFIAGGIGITPILPMITAVEAAGADWRLVYGGRTRASMAFLDELEPFGRRVSLQPQDETGLLDLQTLLGTPHPGTAVYCCGPEALLAAVEQRCVPWPSAALHVERFTAKPMPVPTRTDAFDVVLATSGLTLKVPFDRSILDVVEEAGVDPLYSCREGTCGSCETAVLDGEPEHRDSVLSGPEREANDVMMICVSRSRTPRLVLDL